MRDDDRWRGSDPLDPAFRLDASPFYWLTRVSGRYLMAMERRLKRIGMDVPRFRVLMILAEDQPASVSTLADRAVVKLATTTRIVQRMEAAGLVETRVRATDARVTEVTMTAEGAQALALVRAEASAVFARAFAEIDGVEIGGLVALLERIFARLDTR